MAAQVRPFGEHSDRWQRNAEKQGMSPARWNAWRNLSPSSRKDTTPGAYAQGQSVRDQVRESLSSNVSAKLHARASATSVRPVDPRIIQNRVKNLSTKDLRRMDKMDKAAMDRDARRRNRTATTANPSPYWYH